MDRLLLADAVPRLRVRVIDFGNIAFTVCPSPNAEVYALAFLLAIMPPSFLTVKP
jgi:hypothetical protein